MQLTMEQHIFIVKLYYKTKSYSQVKTKFRTLFPKRLQPNKTKIQGNVKKYVKRRSGRRNTTRTKENIDALQQALERNQGKR